MSCLFCEIEIIFENGNYIDHENIHINQLLNERIEKSVARKCWKLMFRQALNAISITDQRGKYGPSVYGKLSLKSRKWFKL